MPTISRDYDFSPGTTIVSAQVDSEFDKLYNLVRGVDTVNGLYIRTTAPQNILHDPALLVNGIIHLEGATSGINVYKLTDTQARVSISYLGHIRLRAGSAGVNPSTQEMYVSGCLYNHSDDVGNVGAGEDDLKSFVIGANTFTGGGGGAQTHAKVYAAGITAANANNKRIRFYAGANLLLDSGVIAPNNKPWFFEAILMPDVDVAATITVVARFWCDATEIRVVTDLGGYNTATDNTWKWTAEATANNDVVQKVMIVDIARGLN